MSYPRPMSYPCRMVPLMTFDCVTTAYGPPAHEALAQAVAKAKRDDPLALVTQREGVSQR